MIEGLATPVDMKLKLIPIFQHMHHDAATAGRVSAVPLPSHCEPTTVTLIAVIVSHVALHCAGEGTVRGIIAMLSRQTLCADHTPYAVPVGCQVSGGYPTAGGCCVFLVVVTRVGDQF